jgi:hypothetical protein
MPPNQLFEAAIVALDTQHCPHPSRRLRPLVASIKSEKYLTFTGSPLLRGPQITILILRAAQPSVTAFFSRENREQEA